MQSKQRVNALSLLSTFGSDASRVLQVILTSVDVRKQNKRKQTPGDNHQYIIFGAIPQPLLPEGWYSGMFWCTIEVQKLTQDPKTKIQYIFVTLKTKHPQ